MKLAKPVLEEIKRLEKEDALKLIGALNRYERKQHGYIKWLENRPGYSIKVGKYRAIFEFDAQEDEIIVLRLLYIDKGRAHHAC